MALYTKRELIQIENNTNASKAFATVMLANGSSAVKKKLKEYRAKKDISIIVNKVKRSEMLMNIYGNIWRNENASDELIECRMEVEKIRFTDDYILTNEEIKNKYSKLDVQTFEKKLARETILKAGVDANYVKEMRARKFMESFDGNFKTQIPIPLENKNLNPELKTKREIIDFINSRLVAFYNGEFDYPKEA